MVSEILGGLFLLILAWIVFEIQRAPYVCSRCGRAYKQSGPCPHCGQRDIPPFDDWRR